MRHARAWTVALPLFAVMATILIVEAYYRVRLGKPPNQVAFRTMQSRVDPKDVEKISEVPGTRFGSSFMNIKSLRSEPAPLPGSEHQIERTDEQRIPLESIDSGRMRPGTWRASSRLTDGFKIYDVEFKVDSEGRRETLNPHPEQRKHFLLNFGCSFTFGSGVRDSETFSSRLAAAMPSYRVYNFGVPGQGPQEVIARLEALDRRKEIPEADGAAVYLMIPDHVRRATLSLSYYLNHGGRFASLYEPGPDGSLSRRDGYFSEHWLTNLFFELLSKSSILAYHKFDFPMSAGLTEYRRTAALLAGMARLYREKFGNDQFYVVLYPMGGENTLGPLLGEAGVKYVDYQKINMGLYTSGPPVFHVRDQHPTAEAYDVLARQVARDLRSVIAAR